MVLSWVMVGTRFTDCGGSCVVVGTWRTNHLRDIIVLPPSDSCSLVYRIDGDLPASMETNPHSVNQQ